MAMERLFQLMAEKKASDIFLSAELADPDQDQRQPDAGQPAAAWTGDAIQALLPRC